MSSPGPKGRLTAEQKKQNHIESERKRREAIRSGFEKLSELVPDSKGKASSEGVVLSNAVKHINELQARKDELKNEAKTTRNMGSLRFEQRYRDIAQNMRDNTVRSEDGSQSSASPPPPRSSGQGKRGHGDSGTSTKKREAKAKIKPESEPDSDD